MRVLQDTEVERLATPKRVQESMRRAVVAAWRGQLIAPPRAAVALGDKRLTFTCGGVPGDWFGYRSYVAPGAGTDDQVVVVQDDITGVARGVAIGRALGPRRVGGIGAVAMDALAPADPGHLALVGAGNQAWHQLWALPPRLRDLPVLVASRTPPSRDEFVDRVRRDLGLDVRAAPDPQTAARQAGIVLLATSSPTPVLAADDVRSDAYLATLGPKQVGRAEFDTELVENAALLTSDSPTQIAAYDPPNVLVGSGLEGSLAHLGAIVAGDREVPAGGRVFFSVGLAGTEAWLLNDLLADLA